MQIEWRRLAPGAWHGYASKQGLVATVIAQTKRDGKRWYLYSFDHGSKWGYVGSVQRARRIVDKLAAAKW